MDGAFAFSSSSTSGSNSCPSFANQSASSRLLAMDSWPTILYGCFFTVALLSADPPTNTTVGKGVASDFPTRLGHPPAKVT